MATIWCFRKLKQLPARLSGPKETEDTRGFMSVVDKFRRERDEVEPEEVLEEDDDEEVIEAPVKKPGLLSRFRKKDKQVQESEAAIADDKADIEPKRQGRVEPVLSTGVAGSATAKLRVFLRTMPKTRHLGKMKQKEARLSTLISGSQPVPSAIKSGN